MQENRSFDSYFGTYPGADGIPMQPRPSRPSACPTRARSAVSGPTTTTHDVERGRPARRTATPSPTSTAARWTGSSPRPSRPDGAARAVDDPACCWPGAARRDGLPRRGGSIPNYWAYADHFVLQDHMFEPDASWSLPAHLFMVSGLVGDLPTPATHELQRQLRARSARGEPPIRDEPRPIYAWTDLTYLLHQHHVTLGLLRRRRATEPDCDDDADCLRARAAERRDARASGTRCPCFDTVRQNGQLRQHPDRCTSSSPRRSAGTLPAVSWVVPDAEVQRTPAGADRARARPMSPDSINTVMQRPRLD